MRRLLPLVSLSIVISAACEPMPPRRRGEAARPDTQNTTSAGGSTSSATPAPSVPTANVPRAPVPRLAGSATSTLSTLPDSGGLPRWHILNHRYLVYRGSGGQRAVLVETTDRFCCLGGERDDSATITLQRLETPGNQSRWETKLTADDGAFWRDFYRAALRGCCDQTDALQFVDVSTGRVVFTHSRESGPEGEELPSVHHWGSSTLRYVAFHDRATPDDPPEARRDSSVVGVLQYGPPDGPAARVVVRRLKGVAHLADLRLDRLEFGRGTWHGRDLEVPAGAARSAAGAMTGFSIRVLLAGPGDDSSRVVEIPVTRDRLRLEQATLPAGLVVRAAP